MVLATVYKLGKVAGTIETVNAITGDNDILTVKVNKTGITVETGVKNDGTNTQV